MPPSARITPARLQWRDGTPYAADYGDIYFSDDGIDEVRRVFMAPAQIEERLSAGSDFCIGELGFGTPPRTSIRHGELGVWHGAVQYTV